MSDEDIDKSAVTPTDLFKTQIGSGRWDPINRGIDGEEYCSEEANAALAGFSIASRIWDRKDESRDVIAGTSGGQALTDEGIRQLKTEIRKSRNQEQDGGFESVERRAQAQAHVASEPTLTNWFQQLSPNAEEKMQNCNSKQKEVVGMVLDTILTQNVRGVKHRKVEQQQFLWLMHGGPGTGKSHVIKVIREELFEKQMKWAQGLDFQIGAFQAVNAEQLDGDTLHHALD